MNSLEGKKLLILAGAAVHCKVVEAAKELGVYTIVTDYLADSPAKKIADESWMLNITQVDEIVKRCKEEQVDGVLNFSIDPAQKPYQQICEQLNVPCYCTKEQVDILTDKGLFKEYCIKHGVDVIQEYSLIDIEEDRVVYPILIKPAISRGSRGQTVCYSKQDTNMAIDIAKNESSNGNVIIEQYMKDKQDFSLSYIVINGEPYILKIGDRYLGSVEDGLDKQCIATVSPSRYKEMYISKVEPKVKKMISALGIKFAPVFLQGFVDGDTVRFYDPGIRFPGGDYDLILKNVTGFDSMKTLITFALTGDVQACSGNPINAYKLNEQIGIQLSLSARAGKVAVYEGFEEIEQLPNVISVSKRKKIGDEIYNKGDASQRVTEILVLSKNVQDICETIDKIYAFIKVLDENGEDMMVSLFSPDKLRKYDLN